MNFTREHFRAMILYDFKSKLTQKQCIDRLTAAFGSGAPSKGTIYRWFREFEIGRASISDESRDGRPATAVVPDNIAAVKRMIEHDPHITYREIKAVLGIAMTQIQTILHQHLAVTKVCARWIPDKVSEDEKMKRVRWCKDMLKRFERGESPEVLNIVAIDETWIYSHGEVDSKTQPEVWMFQKDAKFTEESRSKYLTKKLIVSFFSVSGHVATVAVEPQKADTSKWHSTICLPAVIDKIKKSRPEMRIILHHDNVSSHRDGKTAEFLETHNIQLLPRCPNSPDLSPNDFFFFANVKSKMRGQRFSSSDMACEAYKSQTQTVPSLEWNKCFQNWFERMEKCIKLRGEYFEK